jgi:hypothetical protein
MKLSNDYMNHFSTRKVIHSAPSGQFIKDGDSISRLKISQLCPSISSTENFFNLSNKSTSDEFISSSKIQPNSFSSNSNNTIKSNEFLLRTQQEILKPIKSSSHYYIRPHVHENKKDSDLNLLNHQKMERIHLHRRIFSADSFAAENAKNIKIKNRRLIANNFDKEKTFEHLMNSSVASPPSREGVRGMRQFGGGQDKIYFITQFDYNHNKAFKIK